MNKKRLMLIAIVSVILVTSAVLAAVFISSPAPKITRIACVGDSLTQSTEYPYDLWLLLGHERYDLRNFGAGSTTVSLSSETPYMNTSVFQGALDFQPDIVIIMLGTNDAQPSLWQYNTTFVGDYLEIVNAFKELASEPRIWIVLPPPIFSNQSGKIGPEYFDSTIIPLIEQVANETDLPLIDVYSALAGGSEYFPDGVHPNSIGAKLIADEVYNVLVSQGAVAEAPDFLHYG